MMRGIRKWLSASDGATAIEFALVAIPFLIMLMGIVETSLFFATGFIMEGAANDAARLIRTGQVQGAAEPIKAFENALCDKMKVLTNCLNLRYEVIPVPENSFINATDLKPKFDKDGLLISQGFDPGGASDDVLVRVAYHYDFLTPLLSSLMSSSGMQGASLVSTLVIKNEPYSYGRGN